MQKKNVKIGKTYIAKISGNIVEVRIDDTNPAGGWNATNLQTGKKVRIKTARKLRGPARIKKAPSHDVTNYVQPEDDQNNPEMNLEPDNDPDPKHPTQRGRKASGKMSGINAAAKLLAETGSAMSAKEIFEQVSARGWWNPNGKTPSNTLYAAIVTEIKKKGDDSRFRRASERGKFEFNG